MKFIKKIVKKYPALLILALFMLVGFLLRAFQTGEVPTILNRDEAALAYNGYLLSETGKDEFGRAFPLTFESFGDYKLPGYPYTLAILFSFLPENDFVVRLPSILAGTALIGLSFLLAKNFSFRDHSALVFAGLISFTPIFFFYSRIAFEANVALAFLVGSLVLLTQQTNTLKKDLGASLLMIIAVLFYNTPLILLPFIILGLIFESGVLNYKKWWKVTLMMGLIFITMFYSLSAISNQKSGITIFSDETLWQQSVDYYNSFDGAKKTLLGNKYVFFAKEMWPRLVQSFSMKFLVTEGGSHPWHSLDSHAHIYYVTYFMFFFGLLGIIKFIWKVSSKHLLIPYLLLASLVPSIITVDAPHATRSLLFIYLFCFISTYALAALTKDIWQRILLILIPVLIIEAALYFDNYFALYRYEMPQSLQPNYNNIILDLETTHPDVPVAVVDSGFQYIITAWYLHIPPQEFFDTVVKQLPDKIGFKYGQQVARYHFIANREDRSDEEVVLLEWMGDHWDVNIRE